jgi:hypothetical protein
VSSVSLFHAAIAFVPALSVVRLAVPPGPIRSRRPPMTDRHGARLAGKWDAQGVDPAAYLRAAALADARGEVLLPSDVSLRAVGA